MTDGFHGDWGSSPYLEPYPKPLSGTPIRNQLSGIHIRSPIRNPYPEPYLEPLFGTSVQKPLSGTLIWTPYLKPLSRTPIWNP